MRTIMKTFWSLCSESGQALVLMPVGMIVVLSAAALAVDVGMMYQVRTKLQATADAAALAAAQELPTASNAVGTAVQYATDNYPNGYNSVEAGDVSVGNWNTGTRTFTAGGVPTNAVEVFARRTAAHGNAVPTFFAKIFGRGSVDVEVVAVATGVNGPGNSRFIIDDEMIDSDVPVIEDLANSQSPPVPSEDLISDLDGDWFIDLPAGVILELPTGQVGDEGLFDMDNSAFPFLDGSNPSFTDFLNYNEDSSSWRYDLIDKEDLDPLIGVSTVSDSLAYPSYVNPNCQVSPVYKSDVSALNPVLGEPAVNALGLRRGLLVFKILAVGADPDGGNGSVLPNLVIQVCDPTGMDPGDFTLGAGSGYELVK